MNSLTSQRVVFPDGIRPASLHLDEGRIVEITSAGTGEDLGDLVVLPGLCDVHVHVNEPGRTEWEGFDTATRAAAAGGITTIVDMPLNCLPVTTTLSAFEQKLAACRNQLWVDAAFWGGVIPGNARELAPMADSGVLGFKCFLVHSGIDEFPNVEEADLRQAMPILRDCGVPLLFHAELELEGENPYESAEPTAYLRYLHSRPREWEDRAIALVIELVRQTGCRAHIVHLSSASALPMLKRARADGLPITVETCPHYLCLVAEEVPDGATEYKCAPPIRERENCEKLWEGLRDGVIDFVISDHSPCTPSLKLPERGDFMAAWGGIASLQLGLSNLWSEASRRGFGLEEVVRWMSLGPASFARIEGKGAIEVGNWADLVAFDPEVDFTLTAEQILHRHAVTPYLGRRMHGAVRHTWVRGREVKDERVGQPILKGRA